MKLGISPIRSVAGGWPAATDTENLRLTVWCAGTDTAGDAGAIVTPGGREGVRWTTRARFMWLVTTTVAGAERAGPTTSGALALTVSGPRTEIVSVALRSPAPSIPVEESRAVRLLTPPSAGSGAVTRKLRVVLCPAGSDSVRVRARRTTFHPGGNAKRTIPSVIGRFPWLTNVAFAMNVAPELIVPGAVSRA